MVVEYTTPFRVYAGDDWSQAFRMNTQPDPAVDVLVPEDLSGYAEWACQWRSAPTSTASITLTVDTTDAATGLIVIRATGAQIRAMNGSGKFDVQAVLNGETRTFVLAKTSWKLDVTRV